jgi:predicted HTH transcriptional regulator
MKAIDATLERLERALETGGYEPVETHLVELKSVPANGTEWREIKKSVNAFLNTRGGMLILGISEVQTPNKPSGKTLHFTGYKEDAEPQLKELASSFSDKTGRRLSLSKYFPNPQIRDFRGGRLGILFVDELPADEKYCFLDGTSYKRLLTGDHKHSEEELCAQEEYKQEAFLHRELLPVQGTAILDIDLEKLNEYIQLLNQQVKITTLKPDLESAMPFLRSQQMVREDAVTLLGMLVCGKDPSSKIGSRCRVQCYVDVPDTAAGDKIAVEDNVVPLMESAYGFILRNIRKAVTYEKGGMALPEYPPALLRECVNNAFAHRDYSINHHVSILLKPSEHIEIRNPGTFRPHLLIQAPNHDIPVYRIIPEAKARNPKLAHILNVFNKWEGRGLGMATLTTLCLQNQIDIPYFRFRTEEVSLFLQSGRLVDERMERLFLAFDRYLRDRLKGNEPSEGEKRVLAYLIKSEEINRRFDFTILLTQDNSHFEELNALQRAGLIIRHSKSPSLQPVFVVDRTLIATDFSTHLRQSFAGSFDALDRLSKEVLSVIYRYNNFASDAYPSARVVALTLWEEQMQARGDIREFDTFNRSIRKRVSDLEASSFVVRSSRERRYKINPDFQQQGLLF